MATMTRDPHAGRAREYSAVPATAPSTLAPLLVATDGMESSDDALRAASAIALRTGQRIEMIAVQEPMPVLSPDVQFAVGPAVDADAREALKARVAEQIGRTGLGSLWPLEVVSGQPAARIAIAAQRIRASLVIMGLGEHGLYERLLGDEMVLRVIRLGTVPVLAVAPGFMGVPARVLAATDFSPSSVRAAKLAQSISHPHATVTLAHVMSTEIDATAFTRTSAAHHGAIGTAFDLVTSNLADGGKVERELLAGEPAKVLLEFAHRNQSDVIATGSHGFGFLTRLWLGSVSRRLVRGSRCSVLVAPPEEGPGYAEELPTSTTRFATYEWAERLEEFTRRNAGRLATMEVIDPDIGAQIENRNLPLLGADFDPRDGSIHVMLGQAALEGMHLTRSVRGPTAVQMLRDKDGNDLMLRIAHGRGQTLVTLEQKD
jgi:nucleotide-binding universal stress UspA family protein